MSENSYLDELVGRLDAELGRDEPTPDDLYELATALAQAVRLQRAGRGGALAARIARARAALAAEPAHEILVCLDEGALLDQLESALEDEDLPAVARFAVLVDLDEHLAAARLLGAPASALLDEAVLILRVHADRLVPVATLGAEYAERCAIADDDAAARIWATVAEAHPWDEVVPAEPILPGLAAWLAQQAGGDPVQADDEEPASLPGRILTFPRRALPLRRSEATPNGDWQMAAADGERPVVDTAEIELDPLNRWQVVVERAGPAPELACYTDPTESIGFSVLGDGHALPVSDDHHGRRAVVLSPTVAHFEVRVDDVVFELHWPDA